MHLGIVRSVKIVQELGNALFGKLDQMCEFRHPVSAWKRPPAFFIDHDKAFRNTKEIYRVAQVVAFSLDKLPVAAYVRIWCAVGLVGSSNFDEGGTHTCEVLDIGRVEPLTKACLQA